MQPESRLVQKIRRHLAARGAWSAKIQGSDDKFQEVGLPDLFACYRGRFIGLEVKLPGEKPSPRQEVVLHRIREAGGIGQVVSSVDEVERILKRSTRK